MGKANANGDSPAFKDIELDAEGQFSDFVEFKWKKLVEFTWDPILEHVGKFGLHSSFKVGNSVVIAVEETVVYKSSGEWIVEG